MPEDALPKPNIHQDATIIGTTNYKLLQFWQAEVQMWQLLAAVGLSESVFTFFMCCEVL